MVSVFAEIRQLTKTIHFFVRYESCQYNEFMIISVNRRKLSEAEISLLIRDLPLFPNLAYVSRSRWRHMKNPYCLLASDQFAGVCGIYRFDGWIKIGPLVLLQKYHGQGLGRQLLKVIFDDHKNTSIFITSSNPAVHQIMSSFDFQELPGVFSIPFKVKMFLIRQITEHINISVAQEGIRKLFLQKGKRKYYVKYV